MKTSLAIKFAALLLAAGYPVVAFAEFLGAPLPASINAENALGLFSAAVIVLTLIADYSRRSRTLIATATETAPAAVCLRARESHCLAA